MAKFLDILKNKICCIFYLLIVYVVSAWYTLLQLIIPHKKPKISNQKGRVALITGGGNGIGFETAIQLLKAEMTVIIVDRMNDKVGVERIPKEYKSRVKFLMCDLSSLHSVRRLAVEFKALKLPLHLLVNNAGVMFAPWSETAEGFESHWVINYLSHFLLTHLLLPTLIESAAHSKPTRIVNLSSCLHNVGTINFDDTQFRKYYSAEAAYTQSKLAMVMFSSALARRLESENVPVLINAVHPAVSFTGLYKHVWWANLIPNLVGIILKSPKMASDTVIHAALSSEVTDGGNYYDNCQIKVPSSTAQSLRLQERLWALSCQQAAITDFGKPN